MVGSLIAQADRGLDRLASRIVRATAIIVVAGLAISLCAVLWFVARGFPPALMLRMHESDLHRLEVLRHVASASKLALVGWMALSIMGCALAARALMLGNTKLAFAGIAMAALCTNSFYFGSLNSRLAAEETLKPFAATVNTLVPAGMPVYYIGPVDSDVAFYSDHRITAVAPRLVCVDTPRDSYVVFSWRTLAIIPASDQRCLTTVARSGHADLYRERFLAVVNRTVKVSNASVEGLLGK